MEQIENPVFGRKIFFVQPSFSVERTLVEYLKKNEYEVYVIQDVSRIKSFLSINKDSLCFFDIDTDWSYAKWFNFLKSFSESEALSSIIVGVISEKAGWDDKDKFLMNLNLKCGFTLLNKNLDSMLKSFSIILDYYGAKGRRKYLRLDTRNMKDVSGYMTYGSKLYTYSVKDISSAGFAIIYKQEIANLFPKNGHVTNICLNLGHKSLVCATIVFNTQINTDGTAMSVLMLTNENPGSTRDYIRNYIYEKNANQMGDLIASMDKDSEHYVDDEDYSTFRSVRDRNYEEQGILSGADSTLFKQI